MTVKAVLFDFGGVVIDSPFAAFAAVEECAGVAAGAVRRINSRSPDTNAWAQLERGEIDAARFTDLFHAEAAEVGVPIDALALVTALLEVPAASSDARVVVLDALAALRRDGIRVGLLTNNIAPMDGRATTRWVYDTFDVVLESCRLGVRKPDERIYRLACAALGSAPARTVFLDDLGINLKPARKLGLQTIKVLDPAAAIAELTELVQAAR